MIHTQAWTKFFIIGCIVILVLSACKTVTETEDVPEESIIEQEPEESYVETNDREEGELEEQESLPDGLLDLQIEINATAYVEEDKVVIEGESNLLPGTQIRVFAERIERTITQVPLGENVMVDETGHFKAEVKRSRYDRLRLYVTVPTNQNSDIQEHYGENNIHFEGPLVYREEVSNGKIGKIARRDTVVFFENDVKEYPFTTTERGKKPEDYGSRHVWMEGEVTNDHQYIYVTGQSNLIEGTRLTAEYWSSERHLLAQNQINPAYAFVNPDGSFDFMVRYNSLRAEGFLKIHTTQHGKLPTEIEEAYGEAFVNIEGEFVFQPPNGFKRAELILFPEAPDLEVPEDVSLTTEEEETMMIVPDDMLFDFDESELKSEARELLDVLLDNLEPLDMGTVIEIRGHTDSQGNADYNLRLSEERAASVLTYIQANGNIDHLEFRTVGYGQTKPIESNEEEEGRQRNRRVEMVINPS